MRPGHTRSWRLLARAPFSFRAVAVLGSLKLLPASWCVQVSTGLQTQGLENFLDDGLL